MNWEDFLNSNGKIEEKYEEVPYKYFLVKDYVANTVYIADIEACNILFGLNGEIDETLKADEELSLWNLPESENGIDFYKQIKNKEMEIPIVEYLDEDDTNKYYTDILEDKIQQYKDECSIKGKDFVQTRNKTENEKEKTVRLIGCYETKNDAIYDYNQIKDFKINPKDIVEKEEPTEEIDLSVNVETAKEEPPMF